MKWAWLHLLIVGRLNHVVLQLIAKFMSFCILINLKYNTNMHNAQKPSESVSVWWRYPGCCDQSCAALGWGWVCEFLRHQSFPSRWWHWATGPTRTLHDIISPTLGDSKTATLHRVQGRWPTASLSGSDTRDSAAPLWPATEKREAAVGFRQMLLCLILPFLQECLKMLTVITTEIKELCLSRVRGGNLLNNSNF